jgi:hypothetical protein
MKKKILLVDDEEDITVALRPSELFRYKKDKKRKKDKVDLLQFIIESKMVVNRHDSWHLFNAYS